MNILLFVTIHAYSLNEVLSHIVNQGSTAYLCLTFINQLQKVLSSRKLSLGPKKILIFTLSLHCFKSI